MSKIPDFLVLEGGDYEKLQKLINKDVIKHPSYIYDDASERLIWVKEDKTYSFIKADNEAFVTLTGTEDAPVAIHALSDGVYYVVGYYKVKGVEGNLYTPTATMFAIGHDELGVVTAIHYGGTGVTVYEIGNEETNTSQMVTDDGLQKTIVNEIETQIQPATDQEIDDLVDRLFPDEDGNGGD